MRHGRSARRRLTSQINPAIIRCGFAAVEVLMNPESLLQSAACSIFPDAGCWPETTRFQRLILFMSPRPSPGQTPVSFPGTLMSLASFTRSQLSCRRRPRGRDDSARLIHMIVFGAGFGLYLMACDRWRVPGGRHIRAVAAARCHNTHRGVSTGGVASVRAPGTHGCRDGPRHARLAAFGVSRA